MIEWLLKAWTRVPLIVERDFPFDLVAAVSWRSKSSARPSGSQPSPRFNEGVLSRDQSRRRSTSGSIRTQQPIHDSRINSTIQGKSANAQAPEKTQFSSPARIGFKEKRQLGQNDAKAIEKCRLGGIGLGDAAQADRTVSGCWQHDVVRLDPCQFFEHGARRVSKAGGLLPRARVSVRVVTQRHRHNR
jgi:hypothetical protein